MYSPARYAPSVRRMLAGALLVLCACESPTDMHHGVVFSPQITASTRMLTDTSGALGLAVDVVIRNDTKVPFHFYVGSRCPVFVQMYPDSTGQQGGSLDATMACVASGSVLTLVPNDSTVLTRVIPADSLVALVPGQYGVNVAVTSAELLMGAWAGTVQLPLSSSP